jgi:hypothetical protein
MVSAERAAATRSKCLNLELGEDLSIGSGPASERIAVVTVDLCL